MSRIKITDLPNPELTKKELKGIYGGPNRRPHDHIGSFTYVIEFDNPETTSLSTLDDTMTK